MAAQGYCSQIARMVTGMPWPTSVEFFKACGDADQLPQEFLDGFPYTSNASRNSRLKTHLRARADGCVRDGIDGEFAVNTMDMAREYFTEGLREKQRLLAAVTYAEPRDIDYVLARKCEAEECGLQIRGEVGTDVRRYPDSQGFPYIL